MVEMERIPTLLSGEEVHKRRRTSPTLAKQNWHYSNACEEELSKTNKKGSNHIIIDD